MLTFRTAISMSLCCLAVSAGNSAVAQETAVQGMAAQKVGVAVATNNSLSISSGATVTFDATGADGGENWETVLDFATNDGSVHRIVVAASSAGWSFTPQVDGNMTTTYPVLRFVEATSTAGEGSSTSRKLISSTNSATPGADVVTDIISASGSASVALDATATTEVVAGVYSTGLTYTLTTP